MGAVASELEETDGVIEYDVTFEEDTAEVLFDTELVTVEELEANLESIGYGPTGSRILTD